MTVAGSIATTTTALVRAKWLRRWGENQFEAVLEKDHDSDVGLNLASGT
jgi:hypothetical protein